MAKSYQSQINKQNKLNDEFSMNYGFKWFLVWRKLSGFIWNPLINSLDLAHSPPLDSA